MAKSKKNRQQDFQKVKLKVGKKLKKADNVTNASFKTRAIQISQQLKTADTSQPSTKKKQNITDLSSQCRHYSASVRVEAVNGLKELITTYPEIVPSHLSDILERVSELLADKESTVRQGAIRAFKVLLPLVSEKRISPFFQLLCAHLCCAMTHIYDDIQVDSLSVLDLLLENYPRLMIYKSNQVLSNFIEQISRQQGQGQAKRSLGTNPNSATSSVKWRSSVLNRLQKFLSAVLKFHGSVSEDLSSSDCHEDPGTRCDLTFIPDEAMFVQPFPSYFRNQWMMPGFTISSDNLKGVDKKGTTGILNGKFTEFADTLVPLMLECWVECAPSKVRERNRGGGNLLTGDNVAMMYNVLQVTQLLWECTDVLTTEECDESASPVKYLKDFEQHFMASFPYSVNTRVSKKDKKHQSDNVQVSAELLNLTICNVMTHFIGEMSNNQNQSHDPAWLPLVTKYLSDFLRGKYEKTCLGQSAKVVVAIMRRFLARGILDGPVVGILSEMYTRFEAASVTSSEKRIYLQFFAETLLADDTSFKSPVLRRKFLQSLPELLPLCSKESSEMASLVISTMKKAACQRCADLLDRKMFATVGQHWYDPQQGIITSLPADDQRNLIGLLYSVPELGPDLTRILVSLARCSDISDDTVAFMIQVLQNRFLQTDMTPEEATVHIGLLTNLLLGVTRAEVECVSGDTDNGQCPVLGSFSITKHSVLEAGDTMFDRQCFLVEIIGGVVEQFFNTEQVVEVMFQFIEKTLEISACLPLQLANGICKFAESLRNIPSGFVSLVNDICISFISHLIMWQHSTNQNAVKVMLDVSCSLLMKTTNGIECLLTKATDCFTKGLSIEALILTLKTVMLFLTESRRQCVTCRPVCGLKLQSLNTLLNSYLSENQSLVTKETEKLITNFVYLVSSVK